MQLLKFFTILFIFSWLILTGNNAFAVKSCTINSPNIAFGTSFNPTNNTALQTTFSNVITVTCSGMPPNGSYTITFAAGTHGTIAARSMQSSTPHTLNFNVYTSNAYTTPLGTAAGATITSSCITSCSNTHTVYGQIPADTTAFADVNQYTDAILMTLTY